MTSRDFCYWLQGYFELASPGDAVKLPMTADQVEIVKRHLALVFLHEIDPKEVAEIVSARPDLTEEQVVEALQSTHDGKPPRPPFLPPPSGPSSDLVLRC